MNIKKDILCGFYRAVNFDFGAEKALEILSNVRCNVESIGEHVAIVESNETGFEVLRDQYGFNLGCVQFR